MKELKSIDRQIAAELLKGSRRSDRELAKTIGVSQPTITRRRITIEKKLIDGYTAIPRWEGLGFEIVAFNFVKHKIKFTEPKEREDTFQKVKEWMMKQPNVVFATEGQGIGWDGIFVSFHKNYSEYTEFIQAHNSHFSNLLIDCQSFVSNLKPANIRKPFHLKYLSEII